MWEAQEVGEAAVQRSSSTEIQRYKCNCKASGGPQAGGHVEIQRHFCNISFNILDI